MPQISSTGPSSSPAFFKLLSYLTSQSPQTMSPWILFFLSWSHCHHPSFKAFTSFALSWSPDNLPTARTWAGCARALLTVMSQTWVTCYAHTPTCELKVSSLSRVYWNWPWLRKHCYRHSPPIATRGKWNENDVDGEKLKENGGWKNGVTDDIVEQLD